MNTCHVGRRLAHAVILGVVALLLTGCVALRGHAPAAEDLKGLAEEGATVAISEPQVSLVGAALPRTWETDRRQIARDILRALENAYSRSGYTVVVARGDSLKAASAPKSDSPAALARALAARTGADIVVLSRVLTQPMSASVIQAQVSMEVYTAGEGRLVRKIDWLIESRSAAPPSKQPQGR